MHFWVPRRTLIVAAGSVALGVAAYNKRPVSYAVTHNPDLVVQRLYDLRDREDYLQIIQQGLYEEWGEYFSPKNLDEMYNLAENAGKTCFVAIDNSGYPIGVLQTRLVDVAGKPGKLVEQYTTFNDLTSYGTWEDAKNSEGDTIVCMQITTLGERRKDTGSALRNAALYIIQRDVKYALTTTPVRTFIPEGEDVHKELLEKGFFGEASTELPLRFHYKSGARAAGYERAYKRLDIRHGEDVIFMRYVRGEGGNWQGILPDGIELKKARILPKIKKAA